MSPPGRKKSQISSEILSSPSSPFPDKDKYKENETEDVKPHKSHRPTTSKSSRIRELSSSSEKRARGHRQSKSNANANDSATTSSPRPTTTVTSTTNAIKRTFSSSNPNSRPGSAKERDAEKEQDGQKSSSRVAVASWKENYSHGSKSKTSTTLRLDWDFDTDLNDSGGGRFSKGNLESDSMHSDVSSILSTKPKSKHSNHNNNTLSKKEVSGSGPNFPAVLSNNLGKKYTYSHLFPTLSYRSTLTRNFQAKSTVGFDRNGKNLRVQVERAMREQKVFSCLGCYPGIRKALMRRGWIEKSPSIGQARSLNFGASVRELNRNIDDESDMMWMHRVLREYAPDFIWIIRRDNVDWRNMLKDQVINRFPKAFFTTKVGIATCLQNMQWYSEPGISETYFPRCYRLCIDEERNSFIDDYRLTACMALLKWVVGAYEKDGEKGVIDSSSHVDTNVIDFAIRQVNNYVRLRRHEDIDWLMPPNFTGTHWEAFLSQYYAVVIMKVKLAPSSSDLGQGQGSGQGEIGKLKHDVAKRALKRIAPYWPQLSIDGVNNVWICKPGARSRGKGIVLMNQLDKILELLAQTNFRDSNWVVQKYMERPLLIYNTKFDIRQWFIVTDWSPLTVWFYKESYIRFCTKPFSIEDFHESIHLCNNAVQCRYRNSDLRDSALPTENMWDNYTFMAYLKTLGKMDLWENLIYPGMKQAIVGILQASQENTENRKNCFELYGADFMCSEDFRPWLIEINSSPCMAATTNVTARMCNECLEDTVKVVIDRREDKNADTGLFELIYKQNVQGAHLPLSASNVEMTIYGKKLKKDIDWPTILSKYTPKKANIRFLKSGPIIQPLVNADDSGSNTNENENTNEDNNSTSNASKNTAVNVVASSSASSSKGHRSQHQNQNQIIDIGSSLTFKELVQRLRLRENNTTNSSNNNSKDRNGNSKLHELDNSPTISPMSSRLIPIAPLDPSLETPSLETPEHRSKSHTDSGFGKSSKSKNSISLLATHSHGHEYKFGHRHLANPPSVVTQAQLYNNYRSSSHSSKKSLRRGATMTLRVKSHHNPRISKAGTGSGTGTGTESESDTENSPFHRIRKQKHHENDNDNEREMEKPHKISRREKREEFSLVNLQSSTNDKSDDKSDSNSIANDNDNDNENDNDPTPASSPIVRVRAKKRKSSNIVVHSNLNPSQSQSQSQSHSKTHRGHRSSSSSSSNTTNILIKSRSARINKSRVIKNRRRKDPENQDEETRHLETSTVRDSNDSGNHNQASKIQTEDLIQL